MPHTAARGELLLEFHGAVGRVGLSPYSVATRTQLGVGIYPRKTSPQVRGFATKQGCSLLFLQFFAR